MTETTTISATAASVTPTTIPPSVAGMAGIDVDVSVVMYVLVVVPVVLVKVASSFTGT